MTADHEGQPAEHLLLGYTALARQRLANTIGYVFVIGHLKTPGSP
jgi:hypothetical protein